MQYADVAVNVPGDVGATFTYRIPDSLTVEPGHVVRVPFGSRIVPGIVFALRQNSPVPNIRELFGTLGHEPLLGSGQLSLARWMSCHYIASLYSCASLFLPPRFVGRSVELLCLTPAGEVSNFGRSSTLKSKIICWLRGRSWVRRSSAPRSLQVDMEQSLLTLIEKGLLVRHWLSPRSQWREGEKQVLVVSSKVNTPHEAESLRRKRAFRQADLLEHLVSAESPVDVTVVRRIFGFSVVRGLLSKPYVSLRSEWANDGVQVLEPVCDRSDRFHVLESLRGSRDYRAADLLEHLFVADSPLELGVARRTFGDKLIRQLLDQRRISTKAASPVKQSIQPVPLVPERPYQLSLEQSGALEYIARALRHSHDAPSSFLLRGVTGSGKTEVYLQALSLCVKNGKGAIVLVPEISLTPQMVNRFEDRFPGRVALLHSGLTYRQYCDTWWRVHHGFADVVIGPRSALFAPQHNLGLIVVDEEQEWTYKEDKGQPRYHGRETALELGRLRDAVVVMGSATPDVATYHASLAGKHGLLELPYRVTPEGTGFRPLPFVEIVDMRQELKQGNQSIFSAVLQDRLREVIALKQQAILFLNRRGSATHVQCRDCGSAEKCRSCSVTLTYHGVERILLCHQCGFHRAIPPSCPRCWSRRIRFVGLGTQRVVEEVRSLLPTADVLRWDRDAAASSPGHEWIMERFQRGGAQILVGTQMVTKGLHFPGVTLVGVLLADLGLSVPDFRANERVFQLLCQAVGRSGRGVEAGCAVIQTYNPTHYPVFTAAAQDYQSFYDKEIEFRRVGHYPPFWRLVRLIFQHPNKARCQEEVTRVGRILELTMQMRKDEMIGPAPAFPERVRGRYRWHLVLRTLTDPRPILDHINLRQGWEVDIDPVSMTS